MRINYFIPPHISEKIYKIHKSVHEQQKYLNIERIKSLKIKFKNVLIIIYNIQKIIYNDMYLYAAQSVLLNLYPNGFGFRQNYRTIMK